MVRSTPGASQFRISFSSLVAALVFTSLFHKKQKQAGLKESYLFGPRPCYLDPFGSPVELRNPLSLLQLILALQTACSSACPVHIPDSRWSAWFTHKASQLLISSFILLRFHWLWSDAWRSQQPTSPTLSAREIHPWKSASPRFVRPGSDLTVLHVRHDSRVTINHFVIARRASWRVCLSHGPLPALSSAPALSSYRLTTKGRGTPISPVVVDKSSAGGYNLLACRAPSFTARMRWRCLCRWSRMSFAPVKSGRKSVSLRGRGDGSVASDFDGCLESHVVF